MNARSVRAASLVALPLALILWTTGASIASAQTPSSDWHSVRALPSQTLVRITAAGSTETCFIESVSDDRIACSSRSPHAGAHHEFARDQITIIRLTGHFSTRAALVITAAFTAAGAGIGATQTKGYNTAAKPIGIGTAGGLGAGAVVGYFVGHSFGTSHGSIVYRRP